jgi:hypothetical protein
MYGYTYSYRYVQTYSTAQRLSVHSRSVNDQDFKLTGSDVQPAECTSCSMYGHTSVLTKNGVKKQDLLCLSQPREHPVQFIIYQSGFVRWGIDQLLEVGQIVLHRLCQDN